MHIPENYLSPITCGVMTAAMVPVWTYSIKKVYKKIPQEKLPLLGIGAAFSFLGMMFNIPLPGGSTGHAVGGTLIALMLGPEASCICVTITLLLQALLFGDGGILAFGANCFNMAFILPFLGFSIYKLVLYLLRKCRKHANTADHYIAAGIGSYIGINAAAFCAAFEFGVQPLLFRDEAGLPMYCPYDLRISIPVMMSEHLTLFGLAEILFTVGLLAFLVKTKSMQLDILGATDIPSGKDSGKASGKDSSKVSGKDSGKVSGNDSSNNSGKDSGKVSVNNLVNNLVNDSVIDSSKDSGKPTFVGAAQQKVNPVLIFLIVVILLVPIGLLAEGTAWGEWGADEIAETVSNGQVLGYTPAGMENGFSLPVLMPDYTLSGMPDAAAYILSAVIGTAFMIILFKLLAACRKKPISFDA